MGAAAPTQRGALIRKRAGQRRTRARTFCSCTRVPYVLVLFLLLEPWRSSRCRSCRRPGNLISIIDLRTHTVAELGGEVARFVGQMPVGVSPDYLSSVLRDSISRMVEAVAAHL